jgi:uncharacterized protein (DUF1778 family)
MRVADATYFDALLREALTPVEPPADLVERLESALETITELAADELEAWELRAMRDPRNWVRPAAAIVAGGVAGTALVLLRARSRAQAARAELEAQRRVPLSRDDAERAIRGLSEHARRMLGGR